MTDKSMRLPTIIVLLAAGSLAGTQLGKVRRADRVPVGNWLLAGPDRLVHGDDRHLRRAGGAAGRLGYRAHRRARLLRRLVAGAAAGGVALALLQSPVAIFVARLVEGLGYLVLVIAIPALLNSVPPPRWRATALAVWGGFVPLGFAIGDFLARGMDAPANPRSTSP